MPILKLTDTGTDITIEHKCANCGTESTISANTLELGVKRGTLMNPDCIVLPPCAEPRCGAYENVLRTHDKLWDGNYDRAGKKTTRPDTHPINNHRRAVNRLARYLKDNGKSQADNKATHDAETSNPAHEADVSSTPFETKHNWRDPRPPT